MTTSTSADQANSLQRQEQSEQDAARLKRHRKMMALGTGLKVRVTLATGPADDENPKGPSTEGQVRYQFWDKRQRLMRALKRWGVLWLASAVCIIFPIVHFVAVPSLFLAGPIAAFFVYRQASVIYGGESTCPKCHAFLPIVRTAYQFPIHDLCSNCQTNVEVSPAEKAPTPPET